MDRELQREILLLLEEHYPESVDVQHRCKENQANVREIAYLREHGLVDARESRALSEPLTFVQATITAKGRDFLEGDGGLSAILGVLTVRIHDDTIKTLIEAKLQEAALPPGDKKRYLDRLRSLPADATKHLTLQLLERGLDRAPDALPMLRTFLDAFA